jgi:hypothetical protein
VVSPDRRAAAIGYRLSAIGYLCCGCALTFRAKAKAGLFNAFEEKPPRSRGLEAEELIAARNDWKPHGPETV